MAPKSGTRHTWPGRPHNPQQTEVAVKTHCLLCAAVRLMRGKNRDTEGGG